MNPDSLFRKRTREAWLYVLKITKMISSGGGFPLIIGAILILFYYTYVQFLEWLPADFPVALLLALIYAPIATTQSIRTWVKSADTVFLLPMEQQMSTYFQKALSYTITMQIIRFTLLFSLAYPLFRLHIGSFLSYFLFLCATLLLVVWNIMLFWFVLRQKNSLSIMQWRLWYILRLFVNFLFLYCLISQIWSGVFISVFTALLVLYQSWRDTPTYPFPWLVLTEMERQLKARYLSIANWFIDLPQESQPIRARRFLVQWVKLFLGQNPNAFSYLYWRSYIRDPELLSMFVRLHIFFTFALWFIPYFSAQAIIILLSLLLTILQVSDLDHPSHYPLWVRLYPSANSKALFHLIMTLLTMQVLILNAVLMWINPSVFVIFNTMIDLILAATICYYYLPFRKKKANLN